MSTEQIEDPFQTALPTVHEAVRKSQLMLELFDKLSSPPSADFPFIERFSTLRNLIAPQISQTKVLFPEFTPHDEALHVGKLFQLADKFFGRHIYRNMNVSELFLLAAALYAHDWGMAVGNDEKEFLRNGAPDNLRTSNFVPIDDEPERLPSLQGRTNVESG